MKKNYSAPATEIIYADLCHMLASSVNIYDKNEGGDDDNGGYNPENSLSNKHRGNWGDLWE